MKKATKITLWATLIIILSILNLSQIQNIHASTGPEAAQITAEEMQPVMEATIQIVMFPTDSLEALGVDQAQFSLRDTLSRKDVTYRYELGLGTLVKTNGEVILVTHDHWDYLDRLGIVVFLNADGDQLLALDGDTFLTLVRYQDGATLILGRPTEGDRSDYLAAMAWTSQAKYDRKVVPVELGKEGSVSEGETLILVRQGRNGTAVELVEASVQSIEERWGSLVYELRNANGESIMPGDSGGGLWLGDNLVGNMWKSKYTYGWDWRSFKVKQVWTDISYAAGLPDFGADLLQSLGTAKVNDEVDAPSSDGEF